MARKLRLEFPGAIYHVINRGNYRQWMFREASTKVAFEQCLFEASERGHWLLHAFAILDNHYHLAVETPEGNLVAGMQWLQATFANRFNRFRGEHGHLFQGRYKSLIVERGGPLAHVCDYIHLNPVRAGIVSVARLGDYRHSSYWYLRHKSHRPDFIQCATTVHELGLPDRLEGWQSYADYLAWQAAEGPAGKNDTYVSLSSGWALGSDSFKATLVKDHALLALSRAWQDVGATEVRRLQWATALAEALRFLGKSEWDCARERKSIPWKIATAAYLKQCTQASNRWLAEHLRMGSPVALSNYVSILRRHGGEAAPVLARLGRMPHAT
jgi:REP element-mobilizing transposase RayT